MRVEEQREETTFVDVCVDFDGMVHEYNSGWQGADVIPDPPIIDTFKVLYEYLGAGLTVAIHSARSAQPGGIEAMRKFITKHDGDFRWEMGISSATLMLVERIAFPIDKPAAKLYIDDRGYHYTGPGSMPSVEYIKTFTPWNKQ